MGALCEPHWPCVIQHADDAELIFVRDQTEWSETKDLHEVEYDKADRLIDASGRVYSLTVRNHDLIKPEPSGETLSLAEVLGLVKAHAAQQGSCCVAKLYAPTIIDAFEMVAALEDN